RQLLGREDAINVEDHDELRVALAHAADEVSADMGSNARRRFDLFRLHVDDFLYRIGECADHNGLRIEQDFDDHNAGVASVLGLRHPEAQPEIYYRNNASSQVDDPGHEVGCPGNRGDGCEIEDLPYLRHIRGKHLVAEFEGKILPRLSDFAN